MDDRKVEIVNGLQLLRRYLENCIEDDGATYLCVMVRELNRQSRISEYVHDVINIEIKQALLNSYVTFGGLLRNYSDNQSILVTAWLESNPHNPHDDDELRLFFIDALINKYSVDN